MFPFYAPWKISGSHIVAALFVVFLRRRVARNIWAPTLIVKVTARPCSKIVSGPLLCYLKSDFETISQKWSPYWVDMSRATFGSLPWRSRSQHDLAAKSCPAHNFVIWSWISKIFYRNDHHIYTTCRAQHLGRYLKGQGHSMTLQQNHVRPITLLFDFRFRNNFTEMINILRRRVACKFGLLPWRSRSQHDFSAKSCPANNFVIWSQILGLFYIIDHHIDTTCRAQHLSRYLEGQGHSMTFQQNSLWPITSHAD